MNQIQAKPKLPELDIVRSLAIIGVLCVHATSASIVAMKESNVYFLYNFVNIFMKFGTTTFIFLSSFVLFYNYYHRPLTGDLIKSFYSKRLKYILAPYIIFSAIYFGLRCYLNQYDYTIWEYITNFSKLLLYGKAYEHLYFVFINIQFYLLFPLFLFLLKKYPKSTHWVVLFGIAVQWIFFMVNKNLETPVTNRGSWSLSYFSYYFLGAYLGIHFDKWISWFKLSLEKVSLKKGAIITSVIVAWVAAGVTYSYMWYVHPSRKGLGKFSTTAYDFMWNLYALLTILVLMLIGFVLYKWAKTWPIHMFIRLGQVSFGIYLLHPLFLFAYRKFPPTSGLSLVHHMWYVGGFLVALFGTWLVVELVVKYVPQSWIIFGSVKPRKSNKEAVKKDTPVISAGQ